MSVKVKLSQVGKKKQRSYRIVVIDSKDPRDGKYIENLGWYNPRSGEFKVDAEGVERWQENGAILSQRVKSLMKRYRNEKNE